MESLGDSALDRELNSIKRICATNMLYLKKIINPNSRTYMSGDYSRHMRLLMI